MTEMPHSPILVEQVAALRERYPTADVRPLPDGGTLISIPAFDLPVGWNRLRSTIWFIAPVGYPVSPPDCFWADAELALASGAEPSSSNVTNPMPMVDGTFRWFSWHVQNWSPSHGTLLMFVRLIEQRLQRAN